MEIPYRILPAVLSLVVASVVACSSHDHPTQIGDCTGSANVCLGGKIGSGSGSSAEGGACGTLTFVNASCQACVETSCCAVDGLCSQNQDCVSLVECRAICTTQSCADDCNAKRPAGVGDLQVLEECLSSSCGIPCKLSDAGTSSPADASTTLGQSCGRLVYPSAICQTCVETGCCDPAEMCSSDPDCSLYVQCRFMCTPTDTQCMTSCQTQFPIGFTGATNLNRCVQEKCATSCN